MTPTVEDLMKHDKEALARVLISLSMFSSDVMKELDREEKRLKLDRFNAEFDKARNDLHAAQGTPRFMEVFEKIQKMEVQRDYLVKECFGERP